MWTFCDAGLWPSACKGAACGQNGRVVQEVSPSSPACSHRPLLSPFLTLGVGAVAGEEAEDPSRASGDPDVR